VRLKYDRMSPTADSKQKNAGKKRTLSRVFAEAIPAKDLQLEREDNSNFIPSEDGIAKAKTAPTYLISNATTHSWSFAALAELLDNARDEALYHGGTLVDVRGVQDPRNKKEKMLRVRDDGSGMTIQRLHKSLSFGYSLGKDANSIGKHGNGLKSSSIRLGQGVVVMTVCPEHQTASAAMLSYEYHVEEGLDDVVVPQVDFDIGETQNTPRMGKTAGSAGNWNRNLDTICKWSPFTSLEAIERELRRPQLKGGGTCIFIFNLWRLPRTEMEMTELKDDPYELDFTEDNILLHGIEEELSLGLKRAFAFKRSFRDYAEILYLRLDKFKIVLQGKEVPLKPLRTTMKLVETHNYKPKNARDVNGKCVAVPIALGFAKESPHISINGFCVYFKKRLIKTYDYGFMTYWSTGRGVIGYFEADDLGLMPTHDKQDFESTPNLQRLKTHLKKEVKDYFETYYLKLEKTPGVPYYKERNKKGAKRKQVTQDSDDGGDDNDGEYMMEIYDYYEEEEEEFMGVVGRDAAKFQPTASARSNGARPSGVGAAERRARQPEHPSAPAPPPAPEQRATAHTNGCAQAAGPSFASLATGAALQAKESEAERLRHACAEEKRRTADLARQLEQAQEKSEKHRRAHAEEKQRNADLARQLEQAQEKAEAQERRSQQLKEKGLRSQSQAATVRQSLDQLLRMVREYCNGDLAKNQMRDFALSISPSGGEQKPQVKREHRTGTAHVADPADAAGAKRKVDGNAKDKQPAIGAMAEGTGRGVPHHDPVISLVSSDDSDMSDDGMGCKTPSAEASARNRPLRRSPAQQMLAAWDMIDGGTSSSDDAGSVGRKAPPSASRPAASLRKRRKTVVYRSDCDDSPDDADDDEDFVVRQRQRRAVS